jgi:hypothetical protein
MIVPSASTLSKAAVCCAVHPGRGQQRSARRLPSSQIPKYLRPCVIGSATENDLSVDTRRRTPLKTVGKEQIMYTHSFLSSAGPWPHVMNIHVKYRTCTDSRALQFERVSIGVRAYTSCITRGVYKEASFSPS